MPSGTKPPETGSPARPREVVQRHLAGLVRRAHLTSLGRTFLRAGFYLLCAAAGVAALRGGDGLAPLVGGAALLALLVSLALEPFRRLDGIALAKRLDDRGGLADRLSTAIDIYPRTTGVAEAVMEDAATLAARVRPSEVIPFRSPREAYLLPLPIIALAMMPLWIFPAPKGPSPAFQEAVAAQREALEEFIAGAAADPRSPDREAALDRLRRLAEEMSKKPMSKRSILAATGRVIAKMRSSKKKLIQKKASVSESLLERMKKVPLLKGIAEAIEAAQIAEAAEALEGVLARLEAKTIPETDLGDVKREELEVLLKKLRKLGKDIRFVNKVLQFLEEIEGEIGEIDELVDPDDLDYWRDPKKRPPRPRRPRREPQGPRGRNPSNQWGRGTTETPFGDPNRRPPDETEEEGVRAKEGKGKSSTSTVKSPQESGRSALSYREKYSKFKQMAEDVLYREEIPVGYREYIKRYFDRIQPEEEE